jgi:hypothetical protein
MKTTEQFLIKISDLKNCIDNTNKAIETIKSALTNKRNFTIHLISDISRPGPALIFDIEHFEIILIGYFDKLHSNKKELLELEKQVIENKNFELIYDFEAYNYNKDCFCSWLQKINKQ